MPLTIFLTLIIIAVLILSNFLQAKWEARTSLAFENYVSSSLSSLHKIKFVNILSYLVDKRVLVQKLKQSLDKPKEPKDSKTGFSGLGNNGFLMFAVIVGEEVVIPGYDKVLGLINTVLTFVFLIVILSMFKNFIMGGITEAMYKYLSNTTADTLENIIRKLTIKSDLDIMVKNSLEDLKKSKEE